ncbi:hypothetical protein BUALT_Bualt14G0107900 [Buddleja alternifolia]|uniref:Uncharacterized protein n=1 Tax=Buddleja alternifolia TaxID=168488 RepID=A0AAV6WQK9_9LAMI|nr:hypothetical protein BUALT_Bualt14G0107900 [Buddleja alternifolia]
MKPLNIGLSTATAAATRQWTTGKVHSLVGGQYLMLLRSAVAVIAVFRSESATLLSNHGLKDAVSDLSKIQYSNGGAKIRNSRRLKKQGKDFTHYDPQSFVPLTLVGQLDKQLCKLKMSQARIPDFSNTFRLYLD